MIESVSVEIVPGMEVSCIVKPGSFKVESVRCFDWINGEPMRVFVLRGVKDHQVYFARFEDLFVPGDLKAVAATAKYTVGYSRDNGSETGLANITGERELLKFLVSGVIEKFEALDGSALIDLKIKKEVK